MTPLQGGLGILLAVSLGVTVVLFPRGYGALSPRSRLYRTAGMGLIDLLLILTLIAVSVVPATKVDKLRQAMLLVACVLIAVCLIFMALLDALEALVIYRRERRAALQTIVSDRGVADGTPAPGSDDPS
jgi:hypothetical protein